MNCILNALIIANVGAQEILAIFPKLVEGSEHSVVSTKNNLTRLSPLEVKLRIGNLPNWTTDGNTLFYTRTFEDFVAAITFVNNLVEPAEQLNHHPDISISYNRVSLELTTHDAQGLTDLDFQLARQISQL
ncbi:4a-hydroxytetrahydrobiopterin dehydratase [Leptolyngbyaceae cyanobacterium CCMR0082]|uniref:4a-hydroxytetrahydrobiopterin dehydratase n=2 Tax=Adonisia turfae TaxID=2950184 RepID=A0A6M0S1I2_9CYAN|nr:4a-hydroxytetrahydrobiopterin dehydratase [Leptothoe sp. LEGE 181152]NEZ55803.1 4a-hydroxytetrahydrobiopterin dehydratase [Adonisia turfae CCMR0081]NEZ62324.1 4a-hydroxytetrahydrobiopterin dehydratase [Adonisia turfae CCMR0082]